MIYFFIGLAMIVLLVLVAITYLGGFDGLLYDPLNWLFGEQSKKE